MGATLPQKRALPNDGALSSRARRRKFRRAGVNSVKRPDLTQAQHGVLVSCTPGHEQHAFRDAVVLLSRFVQTDQLKAARDAPVSHATDGENAQQANKRTENALEKELTALRKGEDQVFTRVVADVKGAVFLRVNEATVDVEHVVEQALLEARQSGNAGSRHCIRVIPVRATCYAKAETAATTALNVVKECFPAVKEKGQVSFAIVFRARLNHSAKREQFIDAIAAAIHQFEPRYKVDLTKPDVVLIVEVLKTSCCIGAFTKFYQLAKLNLREAACPSKPKQVEPKKEQSAGAGAKEGEGKSEGGQVAAGSTVRDGDETGDGCGKGEQGATAGEEKAVDGNDGDEKSKQAAAGVEGRATDGRKGAEENEQATAARAKEASDGGEEGKQAAVDGGEEAIDGGDGGEKGKKATVDGGEEAIDGGEKGDQAAAADEDRATDSQP